MNTNIQPELGNEGNEVSASFDELPENSTAQANALQHCENENKWSSLTRILRRIGAVVLVCSAVAFLLQEWVNMDSLLRYYSFLGFTLFMSACGVYCGLRLQDDKGARTFLGVAALFLPAHFAQLGALVRSLFVENPQALFGGYNAHIRYLAIYQAPSALSAWGTVAIACAVLLPLCFAGFSSLARAEAPRLTALYFMLNLCLLVPVRDAATVCTLSLCGFALLSFFETRFFSKPSAMHTWEGAACRLMMAAPLAVLLARSIILYPASGLILGAVCAGCAAVFFLLLPAHFESLGAKCFFQGLAVPAAALSWTSFAIEIQQQVPYTLRDEVITPLVFLPMALIFAAMSFGAAGNGRSYRRLGAWVAILAVLFELFTVSGWASSFLCIVVAIATISSAFLMEDKTLFNLGTVGLLFGLGYHLRYAADLFTWSPWLSLAITGAATVIAASYLERNRKDVVDRMRLFRRELDSWA